MGRRALHSSCSMRLEHVEHLLSVVCVSALDTLKETFPALAKLIPGQMCFAEALGGPSRFDNQFLKKKQTMGTRTGLFAQLQKTI